MHPLPQPMHAPGQGVGVLLQRQGVQAPSGGWAGGPAIRPEQGGPQQLLAGLVSGVRPVNKHAAPSIKVRQQGGHVLAVLILAHAGVLGEVAGQQALAQGALATAWGAAQQHKLWASEPSSWLHPAAPAATAAAAAAAAAAIAALPQGGPE